MGLGIDIGAGAIKVLEVERRGGSVRVVGGGRVRWQNYEPGGDDRAAQQRALMSILARAGEGAGTVYAGATGRDVNLRFSQVPNVPAAALESLVNFEMQQVKGKTGAVYCDKVVLSAEPGAAELPLLVGLIRTEYADARVAFLQQCRVAVNDVVPNSLALFEAFHQSPECTPGECILLADIGAENIDVIIVEDGRLSFARNINGGGKTMSDAIAAALRIPLAEAEKEKLRAADLSRAKDGDPRADGVRQALLNASGQVATMLSSSINFARTQTKRPLPVSRVVLSGGGARLAGFAGFLQDMLKIPVTAFDPFAGWDLGSANLPKDFFEAPSDMAVAAGLALMASGRPVTRLSFLPQQMRDQREFTRRGAVAIAGAAVLLLACLWQAISAFGARAEAKKMLDEVTASKRELDASATRGAELLEERDALRRRIETLCREVEAGGFLVRALTAARDSKPEGIWLTQVEMFPAGPNETLPRGFRVRLRGLAQDPEEGKGSLPEYMAALKKHPLGLAVSSKRYDKQEGSSLFEFELELQ